LVLIGLAVGFVSALLAYLEEHAVHLKRSFTDSYLNGSSENLLKAWGFYSGISVALVLIASSLTVLWAPGATGSGVAELIAFFNGVNYPKLLGLKTLFVKFVGVLFAVVGNLIVGKEGPLAHIGANLGVYVTYLPIPGFDYFRNDFYKKQMLAIGTSAGVSAAFGAPVGGVLFAYEISKPNSTWKFSVLWKTFVACAMAVFSLAIFRQLFEGKGLKDVRSAVLKFSGT